MQFNGRVEGFKELSKALNALPDRMQKRVTRGAVRKGAVVVQKAIIARAPVGEGTTHPKYGKLKNNIKIKEEKAASSKTTARFVVHNSRAFWGSFLEFGTVNMPAQPFMRPGFDESTDAAFTAMAKGLGDGLAREAKKLASDYKTAAKALGVKRR